MVVKGSRNLCYWLPDGLIPGSIFWNVRSQWKSKHIFPHRESAIVIIEENGRTVNVLASQAIVSKNDCGESVA